MQMYETQQTDGQKILSILKDHHGSMGDLAKELGMTREHIARILKGQYDNSEVVLAAAKFVKGLEDAKRKRLAEARAILDEVTQTTEAL